MQPGLPVHYPQGVHQHLALTPRVPLQPLSLNPFQSMLQSNTAPASFVATPQNYSPNPAAYVALEPALRIAPSRRHLTSTLKPTFSTIQTPNTLRHPLPPRPSFIPMDFATKPVSTSNPLDTTGTKQTSKEAKHIPQQTAPKRKIEVIDLMTDDEDEDRLLQSKSRKIEFIEICSDEED